MPYSVVLLDGKEKQNQSFEELKELFLRRQINQNSLICSDENPTWQMIKRLFDVSDWISAASISAAPKVNSSNSISPAQNPFAQPNFVPQPASNQYDQSINYGLNQSNGYTQNNQSQSYYQAETPQSQYNYQNNPSRITPGNYNNSSGNYRYSSPYQASNPSDRNGLRPAAIFLLVNALLYVLMTIIENLFLSTADASSAKIGSGTGRIIIPLIIDLYLASRLWKQAEIDSTRKWVLIRTYLGFLIFGFIVPLVSFGTGEVFVAILSFVAGFFYFVSMALVLHGKESPTPSRVMIGIGTFAVYFLICFGLIGISALALLAPNLAKFEFSDQSFEKYKIQGKEFEDKTTGAKVVLPDNWTMISLNNPIINSPEARMIAVDKRGQRLTMLEVVPVPGNLDMKQANSLLILNQITDGVVESFKAEARKGSTLTKNTFNEITRLNVYIGKHPAKLLVFEKTENGIKAKGHLIITFDELTFYVLHSWCPAEEYNEAQEEFTFFEKNFTIPDKINSPFTQSAENEKKKADSNSKF